MAGLVVVALMLSVCVAAGSSSSTNDDAGNLVKCVDRLFHLRDSPTISTLQYCQAAIRGYSSHKGIPVSQEVESLLEAAYQHLGHSAEVYIYELLRRKIIDHFDDYLDEETRNKLHQFDWTEHAYTLLQRIRERIQKPALMGILDNLVTTKATKNMAKWAKYANYVGIAADAAEFGLGMMGYESEGKTVGAVGNTASAAMTGFSMAGPPGAAIGAGVGLLMWWRQS